MSPLPMIIIGAGGHAKVLIDALLLQGKDIIGIVDKEAEKAGTNLLGVPVLGDDTVVLNYAADKVVLVNAIGSIRDTALREKVYDNFKKLGYSFSGVIHPSAIVARNITFGEGVQVMAGTVIQTGSSIGANSIINTRASIDHDCVIGEHVHIAPGAVLSGSVKIGKGVHIGTGSSIIQSIQIGAGSTIGAGAVVVGNMPEGIAAFGVPAKIVRR